MVIPVQNNVHSKMVHFACRRLHHNKKVKVEEEPSFLDMVNSVCTKYKIEHSYRAMNEYNKHTHTHTLSAEYGTVHTNVNYFLLCCCCCASVSFLHLNFCLHSTKCGGADE